MEEALHNITLAVQRLEEAVAVEKQKNMKSKERIEELQTAIRNSYTRINEAIENAKKKDETLSKEDDICLSLS